MIETPSPPDDSPKLGGPWKEAPVPERRLFLRLSLTWALRKLPGKTLSKLECTRRDGRLPRGGGGGGQDRPPVVVSGL